MRFERWMWRRTLVYGAAVLLTITAGLLIRFGRLGLPWAVSKYGGSMLWALAIYWLLAAILWALEPGRVGVVAGAIATAVELLKLYRTPSLDAFRLTLPGVLLLGRYFSVWDIVAYWVAIGVGVGVDVLLIRPSLLARGWGRV